MSVGQKHLNGHEPIVEMRAPVLSIVVPTRNEAPNIVPLINRLEHALGDVDAEVIFVDDSDDGTPEVVRSLYGLRNVDVVLLHRAPDEREGGLGGAVTAGFQRARANWVCVMDGDLQHPPEMVPELVSSAERNQSDLVVASRHRDYGEAAGLNFLRNSISRALDTCARLIFPRQLANVSDPMSGFFLVNKEKLHLDTFRPQGFKILLEILVRSENLRVSEVPFVFANRHAGESKAGLAEGMRYLSLLFHLRVGGDITRFLRFCVVGFSGLFVNLLFHFAFTDLLHLNYLVGAALATQVSSLWNFSLTEAWVFSDRAQRWNRLYRLVMFLLMNNAALIIRGPIIFMLTTGLGMHYLVSNLVSLVALTVVRYAMADMLIWRSDDSTDYGAVRSASISN